MLTALALLRPTGRAVRWWTVLPPLVLGVALLQLVADPAVAGGADQLIRWIRIIAVTGAVGAGFLVDDDSLSTTAQTPVPLLVRRLVRLAFAVPVLAGWWLAVVVTCARRLPGLDLPMGALTVEAAALASVALAVAAVLNRRAQEQHGGAYAGPVLLVLAGFAVLLPAPLALVVGPTEPDWAAARLRWAVLLVVGVGAFAAASRERAVR